MRFKIHSTYNYTGGPDCVHQIAGAVKRRGYYAGMVYSPDGDGKGVLPDYAERYGLDIAETRKENLDEPDTVQLLSAVWGPDWYPITPETSFCIKANCSNAYKSTKIFHWLGWTNWQLWEIGGYDRPIDLTHKNLQKVYHSCQSQKTYDILINSGLIRPETIFFIRDYTADIFIHSEQQIQESIPFRKNIVLYNPAKGLDNSLKIMDVCKDLDCEFKPIQGLSRQQLLELGMQSKVYIDFGPFPGREKIPREMAACGLTVITGSEGCADNPVDMPNGPRKHFKVGFHYDWIAVKKQILWDLQNYSEAVKDFHLQCYRDSIRAEKAVFENDVDNMLRIIQTYGNLYENR